MKEQVTLNLNDAYVQAVTLEIDTDALLAKDAPLGVTVSARMIAIKRIVEEKIEPPIDITTDGTGPAETTAARPVGFAGGGT